MLRLTWIETQARVNATLECWHSIASSTGQHDADTSKALVLRVALCGHLDRAVKFGLGPLDERCWGSVDGEGTKSRVKGKEMARRCTRIQGSPKTARLCPIEKLRLKFELLE